MKVISNKTMVKNLIVGDVIKDHRNIILVVRSVLKNKVLASKETSQHGHGLISIDFHTDKHDDLINRVELVNAN